MTLNLIKMAVGIEDVPHLARVQQQRRDAARERGDPPVARHVTRMTPRRSEAVLDGGSIYWVIRGFVQVRQRILDLECMVGEDGISRCAIHLDEILVRTAPRPCRPFQGWRYLQATDAPGDLGRASGDLAVMPEAMRRELADLGLL